MDKTSLIQDAKIIEQCYEWYDNWGLSLSFAVMKGNRIAVSSKHWVKNYYLMISSNDSTYCPGGFNVWDAVKSVAKTIGRPLTECAENSYYVYISNLNHKQTNDVFDILMKELTTRRFTVEILESWDLYGWSANPDNIIPLFTN